MNGILKSVSELEPEEEQESRLALVEVATRSNDLGLVREVPVGTHLQQVVKADNKKLE